MILREGRSLKIATLIRRAYGDYRPVAKKSETVVFGFGCIGEIVVIIEACSNNAVLDGGCPANRLHGVAGGIVVRRFIDLNEASECRHDAAFEWGLYFEPLAQVGA